MHSAPLCCSQMVDGTGIEYTMLSPDGTGIEYTMLSPDGTGIEYTMLSPDGRWYWNLITF